MWRTGASSGCPETRCGAVFGSRFCARVAGRKLTRSASSAGGQHPARFPGQPVNPGTTVARRDGWPAAAAAPSPRPRSGTWQATLCARCTNPDPDFWSRCPICTITWQLSPRPCQRCVLDRQVRDLLSDVTGALRPGIASFHEALTSAERPDIAMAWVARSKARNLLERRGHDERPVTHEVLDELPPDKVLAHLRSVLVATGALPPRDERLVALEKWITATVQAHTDLSERGILHGYALWHHMRRLRRRLGDDHTTRLQDLNVRSHVTAANNFLDWLSGEGLSLGTCAQTDLERWMADATVSYRDETGHFVRWSVQHRHAHGLTYGTIRWTGPRSTIDSEKRWADARRLLNDNTLPTLDRVAGLLVILNAQKIASISQLTVDDVHFDGENASITFGTSPVVLPAPLATLVRELVATRRGKAKIGTPEDVPRLFQADCQGALSPTSRSATAFTRSGSGPGRIAPLHCSLSRPNSPLRSSPGCLASTSRSPSSGRGRLPGTGPPTLLRSANGIGRDRGVSILLVVCSLLLIKKRACS